MTLSVKVDFDFYLSYRTVFDGCSEAQLRRQVTALQRQVVQFQQRGDPTQLSDPTLVARAFAEGQAVDRIITMQRLLQESTPQGISRVQYQICIVVCVLHPEYQGEANVDLLSSPLTKRGSEVSKPSHARNW